MERRRRGEIISSPPEDFDKIIYGKGFPVGKSVCECYLKSVKVKETTYEGIPYTRILFHFVRNGQWITKYLSYRPEEMFKSEKAFKRSKLFLFQSLTNIAACYLTASHLKKVNFNTKGMGIKGYMDEYIYALEAKNYKEVPVCLKTVPREDGGVSVGKYIYFIKPQDKPCEWELRYTNWENEEYTKYLLKQ